MIRITTYIHKKQQDELKKIANERITYSEHIRRAIDLYFALKYPPDLDFDDNDMEMEVG